MAAMDHGGHGATGLRMDYRPNYFTAFFIDPDGPDRGPVQGTVVGKVVRKL
ncbi:hypothetical protein QE369_000453 [Agrobacterium larrymoorei]|uniref:Uncharacterized protein n=1 Tax=Agrobacterium larrymoorei TaxID=160699 RepID=A0AAJ2B6J0_9HYPH|nr:hypothetical protein [Agrobacterium larrymoorei]